jgi:hypothetical protein
MDNDVEKMLFGDVTPYKKSDYKTVKVKKTHHKKALKMQMKARRKKAKTIKRTLKPIW